MHDFSLYFFCFSRFLRINVITSTSKKLFTYPTSTFFINASFNFFVYFQKLYSNSKFFPFSSQSHHKLYEHLYPVLSEVMVIPRFQFFFDFKILSPSAQGVFLWKEFLFLSRYLYCVILCSYVQDQHLLREVKLFLKKNLIGTDF